MKNYYRWAQANFLKQGKLDAVELAGHTLCFNHETMTAETQEKGMKFP